MDMSGMTSSAMGSSPSATMGLSSMPSGTSVSAADMGGTGMSMGGSCKISMTWNWYTVGACFIADSWQVTSRGMFAGSCIGVICLVISFEFLRRLQREYERSLKRKDIKAMKRDVRTSYSEVSNNQGKDGQFVVSGHVASQELPRRRAPGPPRGQLLLRHLIRSLLHTVQFAVAYFIMLLAMYFNGYIIISILIGAFLGAFIFTWDQFQQTQDSPPEREITGCCG